MELDQKVKDAVETISRYVEENRDERCCVIIIGGQHERLESCHGKNDVLMNIIINTLLDDEEGIGLLIADALDILANNPLIENKKLMSRRTKNEA